MEPKNTEKNSKENENVNAVNIQVELGQKTKTVQNRLNEKHQIWESTNL